MVEENCKHCEKGKCKQCQKLEKKREKLLRKKAALEAEHAKLQDVNLLKFSKPGFEIRFFSLETLASDGRATSQKEEMSAAINSN